MQKLLQLQPLANYLKHTNGMTALQKWCNVRTHTGVVAQQVEQASTGRADASKYASVSDTWWEQKQKWRLLKQMKKTA